MAAPAATPRVTPAGIMIPDGKNTKITLSLDTDIEFEEVETTLSGFDNGEPIEQDSAWSSRLQVVRAQQINACTPIEILCKWDPVMLERGRAMVGVEKSGASAQVITETLYDGSARASFGYLKAIQPESLVKGQKGRMRITLQPTNWDPVNNVYAEPVYTNVSGS